MELTRKDIENTYEFKFILKSLKKKYPWIVGMKMIEDLLNEYEYTIYFELIVDPIKMKEYFNTEFSKYLEYFWDKRDFSDALKHKFHYIDAIIKNGPDPIKFNQEISDYVNDLRKFVPIPEEMKMPFKKTMVLDSYLLKL
jgi:hypothetical protein